MPNEKIIPPSIVVPNPHCIELSYSRDEVLSVITVVLLKNGSVQLQGPSIMDEGFSVEFVERGIRRLKNFHAQKRAEATVVIADAQGRVVEKNGKI